MAANENGMWDFRSYDEKTWFRFLVIKLIFCGILYFGLHVLLNNKDYNYEYTKLNQDQMQFINSIYANPQPNSKPDTSKHLVNKPETTNNSSVTNGQASSTNATSVAPSNAQKAPVQNANNSVRYVQPAVSKSDTCKPGTPNSRVMGYLENVFDFKFDKMQADSIRNFLCKSTPQQAPAFLNGTRFRVRSYFWLVGPCVYWEVIFWAIFGVLSSLLFNLGVVGSNATTDPNNPKSQFDNSEIFGQVAKILYAPLCTLIVVLGYNFFKDQNIVDISSSKGVIVFAFIGGFYSSRLISLMDRLKDVLMPNSGTTSLPITNTPPNQQNR